MEDVMYRVEELVLPALLKLLDNHLTILDQSPQISQESD